MKKLSKLRKFSIALTSGLAAGIAGIGITVPLIQSHTTSVSNAENLNNDVDSSSDDFVNVTKTNSSIETENLSFTPVVAPTMNRNANVSKTASEENGTKMLWTESGVQKEFKVSTLYQNNRKFMPMLAYDEDDVANFSQTRTWRDLVVDDFPGWERTTTYNSYSQNGSYIEKYVASETLKKAYPNLQKTEITKLVICLSDLVYKVKYTTDFKSVVEHLISSVNPDYLDIEYVNDSNIQYLPELNNSNLKKLAISGGFTSLSGIKISDSVQEIEIMGGLTSIDPLIFPKDAAFITESRSSIFTEINLSAHEKLTTEELQRAIDIVYKDRINERAFQGNFAGGYIYAWNLRNTGISSFNSVTVPELKDGTGRFYIAYVAVETANSDGTVEEIISEGTEPSNDSKINEWYDWNQQGWEKVSDIIVTAKDSAKLDFDKTVKEIMGFLKKYPNVIKIDVSALQFTDESKSLDDLVTQLKNEIKSNFFEDSSFNNIEFVTEKK